MSDHRVFVSHVTENPLTFEVVVRDARSESRHRVTISADDKARLAKLGAEPARAVEAAMAFLLDREPKESILRAFDIAVIRRYFPDFDEAFPVYLARRGGGTAEGA